MIIYSKCWKSDTKDSGDSVIMEERTNRKTKTKVRGVWSSLWGKNVLKYLENNLSLSVVKLSILSFSNPSCFFMINSTMIWIYFLSYSYSNRNLFSDIWIFTQYFLIQKFCTVKLVHLPLHSLLSTFYSLTNPGLSITAAGK